MIGDFVNSWALFQVSHLASWLMAVELSLLGLILVGRNQIFLSIAVAQGAALGIAVGLVGATAAGLAWLASDALLSLLSILFACFTVLTASVPSRDFSREAVVGWIFLFCSATGLLLLASSPHSAAELQRLLMSSLIGATMADVYGLLGFTALVVLLMCCRRRTLFWLILDPRSAKAGGIPVGLWSWVLALLLGVGIGLSMRVAGTLYVFGCLVLPALASRLLCSTLHSLLWFTPVLALTAAVFGSVIAHGLDLPPAQVTVLLLALCVPLAAAISLLSSVCVSKCSRRGGRSKLSLSSRAESD